MCNAPLDDLLSTVLLDHVQREAVVRGFFVDVWIWTTVCTAEGFWSWPCLKVCGWDIDSGGGLEEGSALPASPIAAGCELYVSDSPGFLARSLPLR